MVLVQEPLPLSHALPPGSQGENRREREMQLPAPIDVTMLYNVLDPTLTPVVPDPSIATGTGVVVCPGGGYSMLAISHEGFEVAHWLAARGIAAFVLKYRVMETPDNDGELLKLMQNTAADSGLSHVLERMDDFASIPLADGLAAMKLLRERGAAWGLRAERVGALGFSAGARLTIDLVTNSPGQDRPSFVGAIYGTGCKQPVPADAPPLFIAVASDDPLIDGSLETYAAWRQIARPVEAHLFGRGGHGFGMRKQGLPSDDWIEMFHRWLASEGFCPLDIGAASKQ
jgi:acetyl esterase/lipase